jgi:hypothetical protein
VPANQVAHLWTFMGEWPRAFSQLTFKLARRNKCVKLSKSMPLTLIYCDFYCFFLRWLDWVTWNVCCPAREHLSWLSRKQIGLALK